MDFIDSHQFTALLLGAYIVLAFYHSVRLYHARKAVERLSVALLDAANVFSHYVEMHTAKGTEEGFVKAQANADRAYEARRTVERWGRP